MEPIKILSDLLSSPMGQAISGIVAMCVVYAAFAGARAVLGLFKRHAKTTETKIDDKIADIAEGALDVAEKRALDRVEKRD